MAWVGTCENAFGFGLACTVIVWIVYPAMERAISRIPGDVMMSPPHGCDHFCAMARTRRHAALATCIACP